LSDSLFREIIEFIQKLYSNSSPVLLHAPKFLGNEKKYLNDCIDTTFVSYVGKYVTDFENHIKNVTGSRNAIAIVNGTCAIQIALIAAGVKLGEEVITQSLTFAATAAAIKHAGAEPVFVDVDKETLGLSPESLKEYLEKYAEIRSGTTYSKVTGQKIAAVIPMHTFGHPVRLDEIIKIAQKYNLIVIEDSAESIGSYYNKKHTGTFGRAGIFSFNGNKTVTTGGGGMLISDDDQLAERVRYITTTAKRPHKWDFFHDEVGYNLRMPNINAAVGCAQMEYLNTILEKKRDTTEKYRKYFKNIGIPFVDEPENCKSNFWLNAIILKNREVRDCFLEFSNSNNVQTRPVWTLMTKLPPYQKCHHGPVPNSQWLEDRLVNIPSGLR
jgi:aminotransferase in exopolysaccharide biosynthesis